MYSLADGTAAPPRAQSPDARCTVSSSRERRTLRRRPLRRARAPVRPRGRASGGTRERPLCKSDVGDSVVPWRRAAVDLRRRPTSSRSQGEARDRSSADSRCRPNRGDREAAITAGRERDAAYLGLASLPRLREHLSSSSEPGAPGRPPAASARRQVAAFLGREPGDQLVEFRYLGAQARQVDDDRPPACYAPARRPSPRRREVLRWGTYSGT